MYSTDVRLANLRQQYCTLYNVQCTHMTDFKHCYTVTDTVTPPQHFLLE